MKNQPTTTNSRALPRFLRATFIAGLLPALVLLLTMQSSEAGSATWQASPATGDWNTAANWTPMTIPNGSADTATFASSNITGVSNSLSTEVNGIVFDAGASPFTITITTTPSFSPTFTISGVGITNNSGIMQNIVATGDPVNGPEAFIAVTNSATAGSLTTFALNDRGRIDFFSTSTAGNATFINNSGVAGDCIGGETIFHDTSTAGNGIFINSPRSGCGGGETVFADTATAGNGIFTNNGGGVNGTTQFSGTSTAGNGTFTNTGGTNPGLVIFFNTATAGSGSFTNNGGAVSGESGGFVQFFDTTSGGNGTFTTNGGAVSGAFGGLTSFEGFTTLATTAGNATLIANGGLNGGTGGSISISGNATGGTARVEVFGNGTGDSTNGNFDIGLHNAPGVTTGSIEGSGLVSIGSKNLTVGANNLSTAFSGIISDGGSRGSLTKTGKGKLTLSKASTYTGGTTISKGTLLVTNRTGSATGTGTVQVKAGTLGGTGRIKGAVTVASGATAAILAPGSGSKPGTLTILSTLTFNAPATYKVDLNSSTVTADKVSALGVTINSAALVSIDDLGTGMLTTGTVFTVISNTAATAIAGTFSNLADGSTLTVGSNTYQVSYEGGTGNDLTLTVQ